MLLLLTLSCVLSVVEGSPCLKHKLEPLLYAFLTFLLWFSDVFGVVFGHSGADFFCMLNDYCFEVHAVTAKCPPIQYPQHCGTFHFTMVTHDSYHGILHVCYCMY